MLIDPERDLRRAIEAAEWDSYHSGMDMAVKMAIVYLVDLAIKAYPSGGPGGTIGSTLEHMVSQRVDEVLGPPERKHPTRRPLSASVRTAVFERDEYRCRRCGTHRSLTIDHITPLAKGGSNDLGNLQTLCQSCNSRKGIRTLS